SMPDNNGNLKQQDIQIPGVPTKSQFYEYDSLNRLKSARELVSGVEQWKQQFTYDRWGNRLIDTAATYGIGINNTGFEKLDTTNQLYAPGDLPLPMNQQRMQYDAAGNLTNDTYTGAGNRTYDAENKITSAWGGNNQAQLYAYDASGQRIKRTVNGVETWQVYGFGGELLAEYPANGAVATPQKEYGYRNGQLLVTAAAPARTNVAASANGATATASETHSAPYAPSGAINGDRKLYTNNAWANVTATYPQWLQVDFNGSKVIDEVDVFSIQDNPSSPTEPTLSMTFNNYGVTAFEVQYWNGSLWTTVPNGQVSGNNKVWKQITFAPVTTSKIKVVVTGTADGYSRLAEVEAWGIPAGSASDLRWLITDHLGTPRMVLDQTGALANMTRHDYLPFAEELLAPTSGRSTAQGYGLSNGLRQQFTQKERDIESGLDYFGARYYSSTQGRFFTADRPFADQFAFDPQTWNLYSYVANQPLNHTDPLGLWKQVPCSSGEGMCWESDSKNDTITSLGKKIGVSPNELNKHFRNPTIHIGDVFDVSGFGRSNEVTARDTGPAVVQVFLVREETPREYHERIMREDERARTQMARFVDQMLNPCAYRQPGCYMAIIYVGSGSIRFSGTGQAVGHGARHLATYGLTAEVVEAAIIQDIAAIKATTGTTGSFWGQVTVQGHKITYRAHTMPDGTINVGTYYIP
ncbi:MAG TPA: RHS repeat-associated core domain-containing protein, partial [Pyrinomonadaceae bacterium]|nr:RHS repeat-associated core domain-containing protein [Pyrinomonadaceae bacterium]